MFLPAHVRGSAHGSHPRHQINAWSNLRSAPHFSSEFLLHLGQPCSSCLDCQGPPSPRTGTVLSAAPGGWHSGCWSWAGCCSCSHRFHAYFSLVSGQPQTSEPSNHVCIFPVLLLFLTGSRSQPHKLLLRALRGEQVPLSTLHSSCPASPPPAAAALPVSRSDGF